MRIAVITGSTRGIGLGLANALLERDCGVVLSGRSDDATRNAVEELAAKHGPERVRGHTCDVRQPDQLQGLWDRSMTDFGRVDIWVNNAGIANAPDLLWKISPLEAQQVLETNLLGVVYGAQIAIRGMLAQGGGAIYNLEGMGSDGRTHPGLTLYGTSKYALRYLTKALAKELRGTPVLIASLRPGMVVTDLITSPYRDRPDAWRKVKPIFNIIADRVETVAPWMADQILSNRRNGAVLKRVSTPEMALRFLLGPIRRRELFEDDPSTPGR